MRCVELEFRKLAALRTCGFFQDFVDFFKIFVDLFKILWIFFKIVGWAQIPVPTYASEILKHSFYAPKNN